MKRAILTFFALITGIVFYAQNPQQAYQQQTKQQQSLGLQSSEIVEYAQLNFNTNEEGDKITNVKLFNGVIDEKIELEFKSMVEVLNFAGQRGWNYISESRKEEKKSISYVVLMTKKSRLGRPMNQQRMQRPGQQSQMQSIPSDEPEKVQTDEPTKKK